MKTRSPVMHVVVPYLATLSSLIAPLRAGPEEDLIRAVNAHMRETKSCAADCIVVDEAGRVLDQSPRHAPGASLEEQKVIFYEAGAVVFGKVGGSRTLQVWTMKGAQWCEVAEQWTTIQADYRPQPSPPPSGSAKKPDLKGPDAGEVLVAETVYRESVDLGKSRDTIRAPNGFIAILRDGQLDTPTNRAVRSWNPTKRVSGVLQTEHDLRVRVDGKLGVVSGMVFNEGERARFLRVFARYDDGWKLIAAQTTTVAAN